MLSASTCVVDRWGNEHSKSKIQVQMEPETGNYNQTISEIWEIFFAVNESSNIAHLPQINTSRCH